MYKTIMVPTDCSGFDREAIRVGLRIAQRTEATLHLVRVRTISGFTETASTPHGVGFPARYEGDAALTELTALGTECRASGYDDVVISLEDGPIADVLAGYATRNEVDLIVISSHARGGLSRFSLGSVTDSLIRHTTIPVLVVKPPASYLNPQVRDEFRRIVVPLDGSPLAEQILRSMAALARLEDAEITLLHVQSLNEENHNQRPFQPRSWSETSVAASQAYLSGIAGELRSAGLTSTCEVVIGNNPAEEIAAYAAREGADLIAIATHGRGGLSRMLRGSVADSVTRSARTSILVLHPIQKAVTWKGHDTSNGLPRPTQRLKAKVSR